jgi:shikimate dehydrogenase
VARRVPPGDLSRLFEQLREGDLDGINVTMPHKAEAARLCDELSDDARRSSSVNTVVRLDDGRLIGHSTDVTALRRLWRRRLPTDHPVLVLGAGGAASAACLAALGRTIYVSARRSEAVDELGQGLDRRIVAVPWRTAVAGAVLVNATPLGMHGEELPPALLALATGFVDLAYGDSTTPAVEQARSAEIALIDGIEVLVAQAADSFRLWTGHEPSLQAMQQAARNYSRQPDSAPNEKIDGEGL